VRIINILVADAAIRRLAAASSGALAQRPPSENSILEFLA